MNHLAQLPNEDGFKFIGITHDYAEINCVVGKDKIGCYTVYDENGEPSWFRLLSWKRIPQIAKAQP